MTLKVMICDDEINICRLIIKLINWEELNLNLVGTAQNGKDAMAMIIDKNPDIVLTDIRMPVYNGIELATKARQLGLDSQFIVISGYDSFGYAQGALKARVADYLLKPINADELNTALQRVCIRVRETRKENDIKNSIEKKMQDVNEAERAIYMKNVLLGNSSIYTPEMLNICGLNFVEDSFGAFAVAFDGVFNEEEQAMLDFQIKKLQEKAEKEEYPCIKELLICKEGNFLYGIFNYSSAFEGIIKSYMTDIYYTCRKICAVLPGLQVTHAIGAPVNSTEKISEALKTAREALQTRVNSGLNRILFYSDIPTELKIQPQINPSTVAQLSAFIDLRDSSAITQLLEVMFKDNTVGVHVCYYKLAHELLSYLKNEFSSAHKNEDYSAENPEAYEHASAALEGAFTAAQMRSILIEYCCASFPMNDRHSALQSDIAVEHAKKYISENFAGECSLQDVADYVHLSPNYLSSVFKKNVGVTMNSFLTMVRINEAKNLLKNSEYVPTEIGDKVGYHDPKHFRKVFRDVVGVTPAKYRSLYR